ncbi:MAG: ribonuclease P protein component [Gammaproteobacteria bacterium]|nr:ribonuclease P protein component [Gammaproteobacteria bacterium]HBW83206.1 ribonuclease P protein component [Gammaproteobacteria bacterium]
MATQSYPKTSRLLNTSDYSAVFDQNTIKASSRYFLIIAKFGNNHSTRLGLIVAKKHIPTSVERNRLKRLIRDSFRTLTPLPRHLDMIVLVRKPAKNIQNRQAFQSLNTLWSDVALQCLRQNST